MLENENPTGKAYPPSAIRGKATVRYRFWAGDAEEEIEQTFEGTMRQVKDYVAAFTKGIKQMDDWGGPS